MRKSFQIIFGIHNRKEIREPIIQERIQQEFVIGSQKNEEHQNKFLMMNPQRKRTNQYLYALDRLKSFYKVNMQSNEFEKIPVIAYPKDNTEKKVNLNMSHARWNQQDCFPHKDSADIGSSFGEKLVQKSSIIIASVSKQDFRPYYAQEQDQNNIYIQSQSSEQQKNKIKQPRKQQTIFGLNKSKVEFIWEDQGQRSECNQSKSPFKKLGGILEDDFLLPSFLKDENVHSKEVQDKNFRGKEVQSNNKLSEISKQNSSNLNKIKFTNDLQFELNDSFQQFGFNKTYSQINADNQPSQKPITHKKSNQIKFCNEQNPFIIQNDDNLSLKNKFQTPWQSSNLMKDLFHEFDDNRISENNGKQLDNQVNQSSSSIEQYGNISFGDCDVDLTKDQQFRKNENEEPSPKILQIFDAFVNSKFDFENHTPLSKEKAINRQHQIDFSERTPVFKQEEIRNQTFYQDKNHNTQGESQNSPKTRNNKREQKCQRINKKKSCIGI
ncbi:unnamed protein product [Paramecium octaurelia]|uniref:Uncharacterized protein n=1 Tax=Paramecium octaurelia TaxID=43137 RepID=A0A8S1SDC2_PAROT|nr:unnamed protein product [Paramecium octaurelia]